MSKDAVFAALTGLLRPYAADMIVKTDTASSLYIEEARSTGKPQLFGAVQIKKSYTSFHLFPVYTRPELLEGLAPSLRKRMQGKSCFNFTTIDQVPRDEVAALIERAYRTL